MKVVYEKPKPVFCVKRSQAGNLFVAKAELIAKNGSWFTYRNKSGEWRENGCNWDESILSAIHRRVNTNIHLAVMYATWSKGKLDAETCLGPNTTERDAYYLTMEAYEVGKLAGLIDGALGRAKPSELNEASRSV